MEMKQMVYGPAELPEELYNGEYKEHKFTIFNWGTHPTAYIENKLNITNYNDFRLENIAVHGGFSFLGKGYWSKESKKITWLGWPDGNLSDYAKRFELGYIPKRRKLRDNIVQEDVFYLIEQGVRNES